MILSLKELQLTDLLAYPLQVAIVGPLTAPIYPLRATITDFNFQPVISCENIVVAHKLVELLNKLKEESDDEDSIGEIVLDLRKVTDGKRVI